MDVLVLFVISLGLLALKIWALVDAMTRPAEAFKAAGKFSKTVWIAILIVSAVFNGTSALGVLGLMGTVAATVYLVDVRPAVKQVRDGGGGPHGGGRYR